MALSYMIEIAYSSSRGVLKMYEGADSGLESGELKT
jgi:hypothetical protein